MRGNIPLLIVIWKANEKVNNRNESRSLNCLKIAIKELPKYIVVKKIQTLHTNMGMQLEEVFIVVLSH